MKIEVGKFYKGAINNCIIQIMAIKEESTINYRPNKIVYYVNVRNNKVDSAPLTRLENSSFTELDLKDVIKEVKKHETI